MRIIKLDKESEFPTRASVVDYFENILPNRNPNGKFNLTGGKIAKDGKQGLRTGELLLFTWNTELVYVATSKSGLLDNDSIYDETEVGSKKGYRNYFLVNLDDLRKPKQTLFQTDLADILEEISTRGRVNISGQAWNWYPETEEILKWHAKL